MTTLEFDQRFTQAIEAARQLPDVAEQPCIILMGRRDYRYQRCFTERTGSAAVTMQKLHAILKKAGFQTTGAGGDPSELSASFSLPGSPLSLQSTFGSNGIEWTVYQEGRGLAAPEVARDGKDAPYALLSPLEFARIQALQYAMFATPKNRALPKFAACGTPTASEASVCFSQPVTDPLNPLISVYFGGDKAAFTALNRKATFRYDQSDLYADMISKGSLKPGAKSPMLLTKVKSQVYQLTDTNDHPAYRLTFDLTGQTGKRLVKITATRIPISESVRRKHTF